MSSDSEEYFCAKPPKSPRKRGAAEDGGSPTKKCSATSGLRYPNELSAEEWAVIENLRRDGKTWQSIADELRVENNHDILRKAQRRRQTSTFEWTESSRSELKSHLAVAIRDIGTKMGVPSAVIVKELRLKESGLL